MIARGINLHSEEIGGEKMKMIQAERQMTTWWAKVGDESTHADTGLPAPRAGAVGVVEGPDGEMVRVRVVRVGVYYSGQDHGWTSGYYALVRPVSS